MEVTPIAAEGRQIIERYGGGGFRVSGEVFEGSVLVHPERTLSWPVAALAELTLESLEPLLAEGGRSVDVLLLGCGTSMALVPEALRQGARERGVVIEAMDSGAACRTYNVLLSEDRPVAAAIIAID